MTDNATITRLWDDYAKARKEAFETHRAAVKYESERLERRLQEIEDMYRMLRPSRRRETQPNE